jgi:hypothetical protein
MLYRKISRSQDPTCIAHAPVVCSQCKQRIAYRMHSTFLASNKLDKLANFSRES